MDQPNGGQQAIPILQFKCQNDVCPEMIKFPEPTPEIVNSKYVVALTWPGMRVTCKQCGTVMQLTMNAFKVEVDWAVNSIGKVPVGPVIHKPN